MKVCYFGIYDPSYARNRILIDGLRQNGMEVIECQSRARGFSKYLDLAKNHRKIKDDYDVMVVGFPGYQAMILARFLTRKPIIFDCFSSLYDSMVWDRKQASKLSVKAAYFWLIDWLSMRLADIILFDTQAHIDYASTTFGIKKEKFERIFVGAQTDVFSPHEGKNEKLTPFTVLFFGTFIPLQGVEYIIEAAKILEGDDIRFRIIGDGQQKKKILAYAASLNIKNIEFVGFMPLAELAREIAKADICLGVFGNTNKAKRVIPNKVYQCLAMKKLVITADTPAIRELFGSTDVFLVKVADGVSLADGILRLKNDKKTMASIAQNGYDMFIANATPRILGKQLKEVLESAIK